MDQRKVHASWFQQLVTKTKIVDLMRLCSNSVLKTKESNIRFPLRKQDLTQQKRNQNCGFDEVVLKLCFEDEGKQHKIPLKKTGFDPTKKGPYKWKNQKLAKEARKSCDVMVHAKFPDTKKLPTDSMASLNIIS